MFKGVKTLKQRKSIILFREQDGCELNSPFLQTFFPRKICKQQTITEATVYVDVPEGTRSKDVTCSIEPRRLRLEVRGAGDIADKSTTRENTGGREEKEKHVIIDGELPTAVSRDDSMWSLNDGKTVVIFLEKSKRSWWESVVKGDPEIDTTKVGREYFEDRSCQARFIAKDVQYRRSLRRASVETKGRFTPQYFIANGRLGCAP